MNKDVVYIYKIHNGLLLGRKKEGHNATCITVNRPRDYRTK